MKLRKLGVAGLVSAVLIGTLGIGASSAAADDGQGTVTGTVTFAGKPVAGVEVALQGADFSWDDYTYTDGAGRFTLAADPGVGVLRVDNGSQPFLATYSGNTVREPDAQRVTIQAGSSQTVNIQVAAAATVTGTVVDAKGKRLAGVDVWATNTTRSGTGWGTTDANGNYVLNGLATGPVEVIASLGTGNKYRSGSVSVRATQGKSVKAKPIRIANAKLGKIRATIKGAKQGDRIYAYDTKRKFALHIDDVLKNGKFKLDAKVAPGTYRIVVGGTNRASKAVTVKAKKTSKAGTVKVPKKRTKVSGKVKTSKGKAARDVSVTVRDSYGTFVGGAATNKKGKYSVPGVVSGRYTVEAFDPSGKNASKVRNVTVKRGKNAKRSVKLAKAYRVTGTIKHAGKPVAGVSVYAGVRADDTDAQGKFTIRGLGKGKVQLSTYDPYPGGYVHAFKSLTIKKKNVKWNPKLTK